MAITQYKSLPTTWHCSLPPQNYLHKKPNQNVLKEHLSLKDFISKVVTISSKEVTFLVVCVCLFAK